MSGNVFLSHAGTTLIIMERLLVLLYFLKCNLIIIKISTTSIINIKDLVIYVLLK